MKILRVLMIGSRRLIENIMQLASQAKTRLSENEETMQSEQYQDAANTSNLISKSVSQLELVSKIKKNKTLVKILSVLALVVVGFLIHKNSQSVVTEVTDVYHPSSSESGTVASDDVEESTTEEIEDEAKTSNSESMVVTDDELDDYRELVEEEFDDELIEIFRNHKETGKYNEAKKNFLETLREGIEAEGFDNENAEKLVGIWEVKFDELEASNFASQEDAPGEQDGLTLKAVQMIDTSSEMYIDIVDGLPDDFDVDSFLLGGRVQNLETKAQQDFEGQIKFEKIDGVYRSRLSARKLPDGNYTSELFGTVKTDKNDYELRGSVNSVIKDNEFTNETFKD